MRKLTLPLIEGIGKTRVLVWSALAFALGYIALGNWSWRTPSYLPLTGFDQLIPLLPWTLLIYLSDYAFILFVLLSLKNAADFSAAFYRMIIAIVMSFAVFMIAPTLYPRPLLPQDPFWSEIFVYLHFLDEPTNCFPSLHVSITLIAAASLRSSSKAVRLGAWIWALAICLSTLTTKQHYVWDVLGGALVTWAAFGLIARVRFGAAETAVSD